ncbi:CbaC protein [Halorussus caseinilyticus]|uniref:CbaC protein n=1 Tax=Halorussus caseinilyticus TaxID=3034025 RepID=A0ABD5WRW9_9EURY|nr:CbaC protein [Halorussus sp. DT72]
MNISRAGLLVLVAFSIPVAVELRVLFGFFGVDLPLAAVVVFEAVFLLAIAVVYNLGAEPKSATKH